MCNPRAKPGVKSGHPVVGFARAALCGGAARSQLNMAAPPPRSSPANRAPAGREQVALLLVLENSSASHYNDACKSVSVCELLRIENNGPANRAPAARAHRHRFGRRHRAGPCNSAAVRRHRARIYPPFHPRHKPPAHTHTHRPPPSPHQAWLEENPLLTLPARPACTRRSDASHPGRRFPARAGREQAVGRRALARCGGRAGSRREWAYRARARSGRELSVLAVIGALV